MNKTQKSIDVREDFLNFKAASILNFFVVALAGFAFLEPIIRVFLSYYNSTGAYSFNIGHYLPNLLIFASLVAIAIANDFGIAQRDYYFLNKAAIGSIIVAIIFLVYKVSTVAYNVFTLKFLNELNDYMRVTDLAVLSFAFSSFSLICVFFIFIYAISSLLSLKVASTYLSLNK